MADFVFSPFNDCLLATASRDDHVSEREKYQTETTICLAIKCKLEFLLSQIKLWQLDINHNVPASTSTPSVVLQGKDQPAECVLFHPTADGLLSVAAGQTVSLWDINVSQHQIGA